MKHELFFKSGKTKFVKKKKKEKRGGEKILRRVLPSILLSSDFCSIQRIYVRHSVISYKLEIHK